MKNYAKALTIAASDSSGSAGVQADLKTFAAQGCYGTSVITALTAQNTHGVQAIHAVPEKFVAQQIDSVMQDIGADAIKIGMLHRAEIIEGVANSLKQYAGNAVVVDPVMFAKDGSIMLQKDAIDNLCKLLFPMATLVTASLSEAEILLNCKINQQDQMQEVAQALCQWGSQAAIIKGEELGGTHINDCLYIKETRQTLWFAEMRAVDNIHGIACTFSAAITAHLAKKQTLIEAVKHAKSYLSQAIAIGSAYQVGQGHKPVHHFYHYWKT